MTVRVRFAPSPTGRLHVGNVRVALINWLHARAKGGTFLLRLDDTDEARSTDAFARAIEDDLRWLGLTWDAFARQSDRLGRYEAAAARLRSVGRLYPCYETPEELAFKRKRQLARHQPPVYDRAALELGATDRARLEAEGRRPHWRFRLDHETVAWTDLVRGDTAFEGARLSDPILVREDGRPLYTMSSVVDDAELGVTDVIRGEDHVTNTAVQIQIFAALGAEVPAFGHLSLMVDAEGENLSKRLGSLGIEELRADGIEAMAVNSLLARLGTPDPVIAAPSLHDLVGGFDLGRFGRATPRFDAVELVHVNARLLHDMPFETAMPRLAALGLAEADADFWVTVRGNLDRMRDAERWWRVCRGEIEPCIEDAAFGATAAGLLPGEPWDGSTWKRWTRDVATATGRKGKALYHPLRLALTGMERGPELQNLLPLIGRTRAMARLSGKTA